MSDSENGWVKLYHPAGVQCTLPLITGASEEFAAEYPKELFAACSAYIAAGFLVDAPGLEAGEQIEEVGYIVKGEMENRGETTQFLLLYSTNDQLEFSFLKHYLDKDDDIAAFQKVSGMRLQDIPLYSGQDKPQRGKSKTTDRFIVKVPKPFKVILKKNPRYIEEDRKAAIAKGEVYKAPARVFLRWDGQTPATANEGKKPEFDAAEELKKWDTFLSSDPPLDVVTEWVNDAVKTKGLIAVVKPAIEAWRATTGAWWDKEAVKFMPPKEADPEPPIGGGDDIVPF